MSAVTNHHKAMLETAKSDERVEAKRREQEISAANFEMRLEQSFINEERQAIRTDALQEQEERIAAELHRRKIEDFRDEKLVQKIRESSQELRELEEKLKAAYMSKERTAQASSRAPHCTDAASSSQPPLPKSAQFVQSEQSERDA